jgi:hypothetical protein
MSTETLTETNRIPRINDTAPNFTAETTQGTIDFHQWIGDGWAARICEAQYENYRPQRRPGEQSRQMGGGY